MTWYKIQSRAVDREKAAMTPTIGSIWRGMVSIGMMSIGVEPSSLWRASNRGSYGTVSLNGPIIG